MLSLFLVPHLILLFLLQPNPIYPTTSPTQICNNSPLLCSRAYNNITYLGAHDSPFVRNATNDYNLAGDQFYNSTTQLAAGVRLLTAQVYAATSTTGGSTTYHLCHTECELYDAGTLTNWLSGIKAWLDENPNDVITILLVNSDDLDATTLGAQFEAADIQGYAYTPSETTEATTTWPTLEQLITSGTRLVTFIASLDPTSNTAAPYLLDEFTFIFENNYDVTSPSAFSCEANRPASVLNNTSAALSSGRMALMNHFLYDDIGDGIDIPAVENVSTTNAEQGVGSLGKAATECTGVYGDAPTFVLVDFFNVGPAIEVVDMLNGVETAVGRENVPTSGFGVGTSMMVTGSTIESSTSSSASATVAVLSSSGMTASRTTLLSASSETSASTVRSVTSTSRTATSQSSLGTSTLTTAGATPSSEAVLLQQGFWPQIGSLGLGALLLLG